MKFVIRLGNIDYLYLFQLSMNFVFRIFNKETGLLEFTLLGLISAGVKDVDVYTFIANNEVVTIMIRNEMNDKL